MPVAVVTGSSTGIGLETSLILAKNGYRTYATMRNLDKSSGITSKSTEEDLPLTVLQITHDIHWQELLRNQVRKMGEHSWKQTSLAR